MFVYRFHFIFDFLIGLIIKTKVWVMLIVLWLTNRSAKKEKQLIATYSVMDGEMIERTR